MLQALFEKWTYRETPINMLIINNWAFFLLVKTLFDRWKLICGYLCRWSRRQTRVILIRILRERNTVPCSLPLLGSKLTSCWYWLYCNLLWWKRFFQRCGNLLLIKNWLGIIIMRLNFWQSFVRRGILRLLYNITLLIRRYCHCEIFFRFV